MKKRKLLNFIEAKGSSSANQTFDDEPENSYVNKTSFKSIKAPV